MERDYSAIEAMYDSNLRPGGQLPPVAVPAESEEQQQVYEAIPPQAPNPSQNDLDNIVYIDAKFAAFQGLKFALEDEEVSAIKKILATRVVRNLETMADEWRNQFIQ